MSRRALRWRGVLCTALAITPSVAWAHAADVIYVQISGKGDGPVDELVTMTAGTLGTLAPVDANGDKELSADELDGGAAAIAAGIWDQMPLSVGPAPCTRSAVRAAPREGFIELDAHFDCAPGELRQTFRMLSVLPAGYRVVLASQIGGVRSESFAQGDEQLLTVPDPRAALQRVSGFFAWLRLGILHILRGYDHLAFLFALLLVATRWKQALVWVTAFTVAHSLTLGSSALGWIALDELREKWAEVAIAISIIYVAAENLIGASPKYRTAVTFAFGLVHGLGFASALRKYGVGDSPATALGGFSLGVELGQVALVAALFPLIRLVQRRQALYPVVLRAGSALVLAAGGYWLVTRVWP